MQGYHEITTQADMDALLNSIAGFHDSMLKELHATNRGYVTPDRSMMMSHRLDGRFLVQSQWPPYAIELLFLGIQQLEFSDPAEYWGAEGKLEVSHVPVERRLVTLRFNGSLRMRRRLAGARRRTILTVPGLCPRGRCGAATAYLKPVAVVA